MLGYTSPQQPSREKMFRRSASSLQAFNPSAVVLGGSSPQLASTPEGWALSSGFSRHSASYFSRLHPHVRFMLVSSVWLLFASLIYARHFRYSLLRPLWYVEGSQLAGETKKDALARDYLESFKTSPQPVFVDKDSAKATLCVVIPSAQRQKEYVFRSLASLTMSVLGSSHPVRASVLEMSPNHLCSRLATKSGLQCITRQHAAETTKNPTLRQMIERTSVKPEGQQDWLYRERYDYALALDWCARNQQDDFVLLIQDDGIVSKDGIQRAVDTAQALPPQTWRVLRLYSSDFWSGWETHDRAGLVTFGCLGGVISLVALTWLEKDELLLPAQQQKRKSSGSLRRKCLRRTGRCRRLAYILYGFAWVVLLPLILGKQHLPIVGTRTTGGPVPVQMQAPGTVGYLYPREFAASLVDLLVDVHAGQQIPVDLFVNDQVPDGLGYELLPNVVDHVGFVSSSAEKNAWKMTDPSLYLHPHHVSSGSFHRSEGSPF